MNPRAAQPDVAALGIAVRAVECIEATGTSDCSQFCRCDDGSDYAIKEMAHSPLAPHCEWFCTQLGEIAGLASPQCRIVNIKGTDTFGSRWETGNEDGEWWQQAKRGDFPFSDLAPALSRIFAFDLFVHNADRHLRNYIVRKQRLGYSVLSFDYSRAWIFGGFPLPELPMSCFSNTVSGVGTLSKHFGRWLSMGDVEAVATKLRNVNADRAASIIAGHPSGWLTDDLKAKILDWWNSPKRLERIDEVQEGIANGRYV